MINWRIKRKSEITNIRSVVSVVFTTADGANWSSPLFTTVRIRFSLERTNIHVRHVRILSTDTNLMLATLLKQYQYFLFIINTKYLTFWQKSLSWLHTLTTNHHNRMITMDAILLYIQFATYRDNICVKI